MADPTIEERLSMWLQCEKAIAGNQSYTLDGRSYNRADLATVQRIIRDLQGQLSPIIQTFDLSGMGYGGYGR